MATGDISQEGFVAFITNYIGFIIGGVIIVAIVYLAFAHHYKLPPFANRQ